MKNSDYFIDDSLNKILTTERATLNYEEELIKILEQSERDIRSEINSFYGKYAKENKISYAEAKKRLTNSERLSFNEQIQYWLSESKRLGLSTRFQSYLRTLSDRVYITRLEELLTNIEYILESVYQYQLNNLPDVMKDCFIFAYYNSYFTNAKGIESKISFTGVDMQAITECIVQKWDGNNYSDRIWNNKAKLVQTLGTIIPQSFSRGFNGNKTGDQIAKELNVSANNARTLARTEINRIANAATLRMYKAAGIEKYRYVAVLDMRTSEICRSLDGKVFLVSEAKDHVNYPPMHPNCYDDITEVYTDNGWKKFKDLDRTEKFWSINPETLIPEWVSAKEYISYKYDGKMLQFNNKTFDLCVTPEHNLFLEYTGRDSAHKYRFVPANKCPKWNNNHYRGCVWDRESPEKIKLGDYDIPKDIYIKFMAYYLSEGSYTTRNESNRGYEVSISQYKYLDKFIEDLNGFPVKLNICRRDVEHDSSIYFSDKSIYEYLKKFGRSKDKFVPDEIKNLSKEDIKLFLECYCLGDGSRNFGNTWDEYKCKDELTFFTSSIKMRDDIGELIMKAGGRPSFSIQECNKKGSKCFNGKYTVNEDVWTIRWCRNIRSTVENIQKIEVDYSGYVYCVDLEKYHTLLVKRNGKVTWSGNCRSTTVIFVEGEDLSKKKRIAKDEQGKNILVPGDMTQEQWIKKYVPKAQQEKLLKFLDKFSE